MRSLWTMRFGKFPWKSFLTISWLGIAIIAFSVTPAKTQSDSPTPLEQHPLKQHMEKMLTGDGQWRSPNPSYEPGGDAPSHYGIRFRLSPDKSHATGELSGIHEDGREDIYFTMIALYNPVTERIITQQIGWNGLYLYGENPLQTGDTQILDMMEYSPDGSVKFGRHVMRFIGEDVHESDAFEKGETGDWELKAQWVWRRHPA